MVGDYMSTSFVNGKAYPVLIIARRGNCSLGQITSCKETSAIPVGGLAPAAGTIPVRHDPVLYTGPSQVARGANATAG